MSANHAENILTFEVDGHRVLLGAFDGNDTCDCIEFTAIMLPWVGSREAQGHALRCGHIMAAREQIMRNWLKHDWECDLVIQQISEQLKQRKYANR